MAKIAKKLGTPLMPAQQLVADVGLEINPETGLFAYREVIVSLPRQNGKTSLLLAIEIDRCLMWPPPQRVVYTAQTGSDAREKLLIDQVPVLEKSVLAGTVRRVDRAKGEERIRFRNGSLIELAASTQESAHGFAVDLGVLDEAWKDEDDRREQALLPAMNTRPWAQMWLASTQGTDKSVYLNRKTDLGRAAATADRGHGVAYFEWSVPRDEDMDDPEVWWRYTPALGWTILPEAIAHARETMQDAEWRRAYGNQATRNERDHVIPLSLWQAVQLPGAEVARGKRISFGVDVLPDRSAAAIAVSDGETVELVDHRPGTGWIVERLKELKRKWGGRAALDAGGPAGSLVADLEAARLRLLKLAAGDVAAACARIYDAIADGVIRVRQDPALDEAVDALAKKPLGDRFVWSRSTSTADITPFYAATLAYAAQDRAPSFAASGGVWSVTL